MATFSQGSRFKFGRISTFRNEQVVLPEVINYNTIRAISTFVILPQEEFREDLISFRAFGRSDLGWFIMGFNRISDISKLKRNIKLNVPDLTGIL